MIELELGGAQVRGSMTVFPLIEGEGSRAEADGELRVSLLVDALAEGTLAITEVGEGTVPWLLAVNQGRDPVLVLDGEQLVGAKQDRMVNRSILLGALTETRIPVSCMEQGRWTTGARDVRSAPRQAPAGVRRKARSVEAARVSAGQVASHEVLSETQHEVWAEISELSARVQARSATGALDDVFEARRGEVDLHLSAFPGVPGQRGVVVFAGDRPIGLDAVGSARLWARLHERFLRGYVLDAMDTNDPGTPDPVSFLRRVDGALRTGAPTVGAGRYLVLSGSVVGGELEADGAVIHQSAFPVGDHRRREGRDARNAIARPSVRSRYGDHI